MRLSLLILAVLFFIPVISQTEEESIYAAKRFQDSLNTHFKNPETSILPKEGQSNFKGLEFYPIEPDFCVVATFVRTPGEAPFLMPTTTDRLPEYIKYGELHFRLHGKVLQLALYQNTAPKAGYENYLFLPFTDRTSGNGSYGGGRYLDVLIPEKDTIVLDFNRAYNPYCVYNPRYSCPIPPKENDLPIAIEAGVKDFKVED